MIKLIYMIVVGAILFLILLQYLFFDGLNHDFIGSLVPNFITELLGIAFTLFIIDKLLDAHNKRENKRVVKEIIGNQYNQFIQNLTMQYIQFITKEPTENLSKEILTTIVNSLDKYIQIDFVSKPIKQIIIGRNPNDLFAIETIMTGYQEFLEFQLKREFNNSITEFLGRYISVVPSDIRNTIFRISDILKGNLFVTPLQHGLRYDISNAVINVEDFIREYNILGKELLKLYNFLE